MGSRGDGEAVYGKLSPQTPKPMSDKVWSFLGCTTEAPRRENLNTHGASGCETCPDGGEAVLGEKI